MYLQLTLLGGIFLANGFASDETPQVEVTQGPLVGAVYESRNGRQFYGFTGIPFAQPPVGALRFKPPRALKPWKGILDATKPHAVCPQIDLLFDNETVIGDENCLFLNVYTPQLPSTEQELLPVMVYIHGGWYATGSANINYNGPKYFMDKDVVLVAANYRLGPLGFLSLGDTNALANNGLRDQSMAIQWVKQNIASFGGDPTRITLFGHTTGANSAHLHMLSPFSKDLISGVIAQSGSALQFTATAPFFQVALRTKILAGFAGCETYRETTENVIKCLKEADADEMIKNANQFKIWDIDPIIEYGPVLEMPISEAFITEDPIDTIINSRAADVPLMIGLTTEEGAIRTADLFSKPDILQQLNANFSDYGSILLHLENIAIVKNMKPGARKTRKFYFGDSNIDESTKSRFTKMYTDSAFLTGIDPTVELHTKYYTKPVYYYLFGYKGSASMCSLYDSKSNFDYGVCNGDDLLYLFDSDKLPNFQPTEDDEKMIDVMISLWTNFATYGNPTPEGDTMFSEKWEAVQRNKQNYYYIKNHLDMKTEIGLYTKRVQFWRKLEINTRQDKIRDEILSNEKVKGKDEL